MAIDEVAGEVWTRRHDHPGMPVVPGASRTRYPKGVADSDSVVQTHDPNNQHQAMGRTLYDLLVGVPGCLDPGFIDRLLGETVKPFAIEPLNIS